MPVSLQTDAQSAVAISDADITVLIALFAADRAIFRKVQRIVRVSGTIYALGRTNGWWKFKPAYPFWAASADPFAVVVPPPPPLSGFAPPDIMDLRCTDLAAVEAWCPAYNMSGAFGPADKWGNPDGWGRTAKTGNADFLTGPNGFPFAKVEIGTGVNNLRAIDWFFRFGADKSKLANVQPVDEIYGRFCVYVYPDVLVGMNPALKGCKLSGFFATNDYNYFVAEHSLLEPQNTDSAELTAYYSDVAAAQHMAYFGARGKYARWLTFRLRAKMNTIGADGTVHADGIAELWADEVLAWSKTDIQFRSDPSVKWSGMQGQIYHGGQNDTLFHPVHYGVGGFAISTKPIGPCPELPFAPPAPPALAWTPVPGTANMSGIMTAAGGNVINAWNGLAIDVETDVIYSAACSGHDQGNGNGWTNMVAAVDKQWRVIDPGSVFADVRKNAWNADGRPTARHTYYTTHIVKGADGVKRIYLVTIYAPYDIGMADAGTDWNVCSAFNLMTGKWEAPSFLPRAPFTASTGVTSVCQDMRTGDIYIAGNDNFARLLNGASAWDALPSTYIFNANGGYIASSWEYHPSLIDSKRNRWVHLSERVGLQYIGLSSWKSFVLGGSVMAEGYSPMVHDTANDVYLTLQAGNVIAINPDTGVSKLLCAAPVPTNGCNSRFLYSALRKGVFYLPSFESDLLFLSTAGI